MAGYVIHSNSSSKSGVKRTTRPAMYKGGYHIIRVTDKSVRLRLVYAALYFMEHSAGSGYNNKYPWKNEVVTEAKIRQRKAVDCTGFTRACLSYALKKNPYEGKKKGYWPGWEKNQYTSSGKNAGHHVTIMNYPSFFKVEHKGQVNSSGSNLEIGDIITTKTHHMIYVGSHTTLKNYREKMQKKDKIKGSRKSGKVLYPGDKEELKFSAHTKLSYKSSKTNVITINSKGVMTAKGIGTATITITSNGDDIYAPAKKTIKVTVTKEKTEEDEKQTVSKDTQTVSKDTNTQNTRLIRLNEEDDKITNESYKFESSNSVYDSTNLEFYQYTNVNENNITNSTVLLQKINETSWKTLYAQNIYNTYDKSLGQRILKTRELTQYNIPVDGNGLLKSNVTITGKQVEKNNWVQLYNGDKDLSLYIKIEKR